MDGRPLKMQAGAAASAYDTVSHDAPAVSGTPSMPPVPAAPTRSARQRPSSVPAEDLSRGWRYRSRKREDGREELVQVPLTPEDLLNPQEGDVLSDGYAHNTSVLPLGGAIQRHLRKKPFLLVTRGVVITLHDGTNCAPDIAVVQLESEIDTSKIKRAVKLHDVNGHLIFALEAVSTSDKDVENKDIKKNVLRYAACGVAEYLTYYPVGDTRAKDLVGRRLPKPGGVYQGYRGIAADAEGRIHAEVLDLHFFIDSGGEVVAYDATTGQKLLTAEEEEAGRLQAEAGRAQAEAERVEAERRLAEEAEARRQAEQLNREMTAELERLRAKLSDDNGAL